MLTAQVEVIILSRSSREKTSVSRYLQSVWRRWMTSAQRYRMNFQAFVRASKMTKIYRGVGIQMCGNWRRNIKVVFTKLHRSNMLLNDTLPQSAQPQSLEWQEPWKVVEDGATAAPPAPTNPLLKSRKRKRSAADPLQPKSSNHPSNQNSQS